MSAIPSWCRVGERVVCIDGDFSMFPPKKLSCAPNRPIAGETYTIRRVRVYPHGVFLLLKEVRNKRSDYGRWHGEAQFGAIRFRPFVPLEDDIEAHFNQHLTTSSFQEVDA